MLAHPSKNGREADATRRVRTVFLKRGSSTTLHHHAESSAWMHVVSGAMVDERWHRTDTGKLVHERRVLRGNQALAAPVASLHRVHALQETAFVTTCADGCCGARGANRSEALAVRSATRRVDRSAFITAVGERSPT